MEKSPRVGASAGEAESSLESFPPPPSSPERRSASPVRAEARVPDPSLPAPVPSDEASPSPAVPSLVAVRTWDRLKDEREKWKDFESFCTSEWEAVEPDVGDWWRNTPEYYGQGWPLQVFGPRERIRAISNMSTTGFLAFLDQKGKELLRGYFLFKVYKSLLRRGYIPGTTDFLDSLEDLWLEWPPQNDPYGYQLHKQKMCATIPADHPLLNSRAILATLNLGADWMRLQKIGNNPKCLDWSMIPPVKRQRLNVTWVRLKETGHKAILDEAVKVNFRVDHWFDSAPPPPESALVPGEPHSNDEKQARAPDLSTILDSIYPCAVTPQPSPLPPRNPGRLAPRSPDPENPASDPSNSQFSDDTARATPDSESPKSASRSPSPGPSSKPSKEERKRQRKNRDRATSQAIRSKAAAILAMLRSTNAGMEDEVAAPAAPEESPVLEKPAVEDKLAVSEEWVLAGKPPAEEEAAVPAAEDHAATQPVVVEEPAQDAPAPPERNEAKEKRKAKEQRRKERRRAEKAQMEKMARLAEEDKARSREEQRREAEEKLNREAERKLQADRQKWAEDAQRRQQEDLKREEKSRRREEEARRYQHQVRREERQRQAEARRRERDAARAAANRATQSAIATPPADVPAPPILEIASPEKKPSQEKEPSIRGEDTRKVRPVLAPAAPPSAAAPAPAPAAPPAAAPTPVSPPSLAGRTQGALASSAESSLATETTPPRPQLDEGNAAPRTQTALAWRQLERRARRLVRRETRRIVARDVRRLVAAELDRVRPRDSSSEASRVDQMMVDRLIEESSWDRRSGYNTRDCGRGRSASLSSTNPLWNDRGAGRFGSSRTVAWKLEAWETWFGIFKIGHEVETPHGTPQSAPSSEGSSPNARRLLAATNNGQGTLSQDLDLALVHLFVLFYSADGGRRATVVGAGGHTWQRETSSLLPLFFCFLSHVETFSPNPGSSHHPVAAGVCQESARNLPATVTSDGRHRCPINLVPYLAATPQHLRPSLHKSDRGEE
ncbi:hypothetical protein QBC34DRAFT_464721 [Podospora aff. communis PSN243]|uniref:Reticulocyte-binding protein 2-like a n=1 Tax=Podospora aff. communis PSN243 TaxID=3040156 RepID=A0AAV9H4L0_9PEZI|nr:hypothetical protein QBC34DRAFT_464721 [Podospora aff. communis PSN243]